MKKFLFIFFCCIAALLSAVEPKDWPAEEFLGRVRNPPGRKSWALMKGNAQHTRSDSRPVKAPIEMGIFFTPVRTLAQIRFNEKEIYNIGQSYGKDGVTSVSRQIPVGFKPQIGIFGITPEDLAMSFLYWNFKEEFPQTSVRAQNCRVFLLTNHAGTESVKVYVSCNYFFPLRADWFKTGENEPVRSLEASAFKKENDYWFVSKIILSGKDWKTVIRFPETSAGEFKDKLPSGVFVR